MSPGSGAEGLKSLCAPYPAENCYMHQSKENIAQNERQEKACEPGVDYGECDCCWLCQTHGWCDSV